MKKTYALAVLLVVAALGSGCASVPQGSKEQDAKLKTFAAPPADKAGLYIYSNEWMGMSEKHEIELDGISIGSTIYKSYMYKELAPGKHLLKSNGENSSTLEVDLKPGTLTYVWNDISIGFLWGRVELILVDEKTGQKGVLEGGTLVTK